ncbi:Integrase catalytic region [Pseudobacteroides cellulosolvens ATCC 35603 = DSM 2933]|uniref:Integrase catalytic region n=2 Tax=Pseudobacteroides cellulosolvens TaxID=35825 RepID=A0A0L6JQ42_9FIRM|nr:Integrase catalytic region [Pseudobacteroides cellulosolvens ATCC 35603 = DSM 2933]
MCQIFNISRSSFYEWLKRPESNRKKNDKELIEIINKIHKESYETYGQKRIKIQLNKEGILCSKRRIKRLMNENGIVSRLKRKFKATTNSNHTYPVSPNLLNQDFTTNRPNEKWVGDITYIPTDEGWLYLASIQDLFSKKVVGWSLGSRITKELAISALNQAMIREKPGSSLIFHSDRGCQYAAYEYQDRLRERGIRQSMSRKGNCYDNACAESFFATLKKDIIHGRRFKTREDAKLIIIEYIETFYNFKRIHSTLGNMSPIEFEKDYRNRHSA